ncbi:zinc finger protein 664-like isoform X6 [Alosa alosa]|uniref:zinc finger protein 664-like isoform X6 n=1 Tax=Alosa alosa TaxID=278164 RepID=UPI0020151C44|nr:zinc finger protein 664-like isoform X6 [Alosa alosa]
MDLGLPFSPGCAETHHVDLRVIVKEEDIKEEEYGHMIACPDEEEKLFAEFHCKSETDVTETPESTYNEMLPTTVKTEVKKEEEEEEEQHEHLLESVSEHPHVTRQRIHGLNDELNLQLKERLHHCSVCRRSFTTLTKLEKHQRTHSVRVNEKEKKEKSRKKTHKYSHCGKAFTTPSLVNHCMLTQTGEKPHKCSQCGKGFSHRSSLSRHMLVHKGEEPNKGMKPPSGEKSHECTQCGKGFRLAGNLKIHMLVHTGERHHNCSQCGKSFRTSQDLQRHKITHTGEKPHECVQCGKSFFIQFNS